MRSLSFAGGDSLLSYGHIATYRYYCAVLNVRTVQSFALRHAALSLLLSAHDVTYSIECSLVGNAALRLRLALFLCMCFFFCYRDIAEPNNVHVAKPKQKKKTQQVQ